MLGLEETLVLEGTTSSLEGTALALQISISQTHKVAAVTHVQSYFAAADHPSVPYRHIHFFKYWSIDKTVKFSVGKQWTFPPNFQWSHQVPIIADGIY